MIAPGQQSLGIAGRRQPDHVAAGMAADPDAGAVRDVLDRAVSVLATHVDQDSVCDGCVQMWARLTPFPCEQRRWAMAVSERYGGALLTAPRVAAL
jgi:hypothetical protein